MQRQRFWRYTEGAGAREIFVYDGRFDCVWLVTSPVGRANKWMVCFQGQGRCWENMQNVQRGQRLQMALIKTYQPNGGHSYNFVSISKCQSLPVSVKDLCLFVQFLARSFTSVDSIRNCISGVRTLHSPLGLTCGANDSLDIKLLLLGIERLQPHKGDRRLLCLPLSFQYLLE